MSGLLDSKKRILDTLITNEGRRQLARGRMKIRFATFTDQDAYYESDPISGSTDAGLRPHFETFNRPQDTLTFESDDVGDLIRAPGGDFGVLNGKILIPSEKYQIFLSGSESLEYVDDLFASSSNAFTQLYAISSEQFDEDNNVFELDREQIKFSLTDSTLDEQSIKVVSIDDVESLFQDKRLSHTKNFKFLPPINKKSIENPQGTLLARYNRIDQGDEMTLEKVMSDLSGKEFATINFSQTSYENNFIAQLFDIRQDKVTKLDVIDFGEFVTQDISKHIYFIGRILKDSRSASTFVNIFTLVTES
jgi:hypothetical protein